MNISELDSFVLKVRQLWRAGYDAHLHVETHQGHAWCNLQVHLGPAAVPGPVRPQQQQQQQQQVKTKRKSPSYIRRKEARAAARAVAARESAAEAVENTINDAVKIAEEAVAKKEAEKAAFARVTEAVVAVGRGVAATAKKIAEEAIARKRQAEEAAAKKATEEAEAKRAEEAIAAPVNDPISPNKDRISPSVYLKHREVYRYKDCDDMKIPPRWPAPAWFCELLGTRNHHGNVKFIVSQALRTFIGHHENNVMTNYIFVKRLWAAMSHLPLNVDTGFLPSVEFAVAMYGTQNIPFEQIKWSTLCTSLHEHVYFNSSLIGVFSGRKMKK